MAVSPASAASSTGCRGRQANAKHVVISSLPDPAAGKQPERDAVEDEQPRAPGAKQYSPPRVMTNGGILGRRRWIGRCGMVPVQGRDPTWGSLSRGAPVKIAVGVQGSDGANGVPGYRPTRALCGFRASGALAEQARGYQHGLMSGAVMP